MKEKYVFINIKTESVEEQFQHAEVQKVIAIEYTLRCHRWLVLL